jgi:integrase
LRQWKKTDRNFYLVVLTCLLTGCRVSEVTGLLKNQLKETPVPHIDIKDSKTSAGIRRVPLIPELFNELMEFSKYKTAKDQVFKYQIRLGKGSGNAVGQKFGRHLDKVGIDNDKLVFHSLRKFFNDYSMRKGKVPIEVRCQMIGHELDNINVSTYSSDFEIDQLAEVFSPIQKNILALTGFDTP